MLIINEDNVCRFFPLHTRQMPRRGEELFLIGQTKLANNPPTWYRLGLQLLCVGQATAH
jgi:hypothetical protein